MKKPIFIDGLHPALKWKEIKSYRDHLLTSCDYTQISDSSISDEKRDEFKCYRQNLRDLPQKYDNPDDVVWPTKPE